MRTMATGRVGHAGYRTALIYLHKKVYTHLRPCYDIWWPVRRFNPSGSIYHPPYVEKTIKVDMAYGTDKKPPSLTIRPVPM